MKYFLIFLCQLFSVCLCGQSTTYHPFPEGNATWNYRYYQDSWAMPPNDYTLINYSITFSGDTLINNLKYNKLTTPFVAFRKGYRGAIRQDVAARKVFIMPPTKRVEELLYDFNLQIGDSVKGYIYYHDIVEDIDSVLVGNSFRKRWRINSAYNVDIIEGIGSTYGLLEESPTFCTDCPDFQLTCYSENNQTLYPDSQTNCEIINSVKPIDKNSDEIKICSNSQNGSITIEFENTNLLEIKLIDIFANVVFQQSTRHQKSITIDHLQAGIYILIGKSSNNKLITKKIVSCP
jgi:hypothetical protein